MTVTNETVWGYLSRLSATPHEHVAPIGRLFDYSIDSSGKTISWEVQAKGSIGKVAAMTLVPKGNEGPSEDSCNRSLRKALRLFPDENVESVKKIEIQENGINLSCVILYPKGFDAGNNAKCTVYNSPNGVTVEELLRDGFDPKSTPFKIFMKTVCPIILYDYRGTGINKQSVAPSANSVTLDGLSVLNFAAKKFQQIDVWGSSLGGAVATLACDSYIIEHPDEFEKIKLYSIDSYTSTRAVTLPPNIALFTHLIGQSLDTVSAMKSLVARKVKVTLLCHLADPIIKPEMRQKGQCELITSIKYGHGNLTQDMLEKLVSQSK